MPFLVCLRDVTSAHWQVEKKAEVHELAEELAGLVDPPAEVAQARPLLLSLLCRSSTRRSSGPFRTSPSAQVLGHTALFYRTSPRRLIKLET